MASERRQPTAASRRLTAGCQTCSSWPGANGAGKSTSAPQVLSGVRRVDEFVNADVIARQDELSDIEAGRRTLERLEALARARRDIAFETTLANTVPPPGHLVAGRDVGGSVRVRDNRLWSHLVSRYMKPRAEQGQAQKVPQPMWTAEDVMDAVNRAVTEALRRHKERGESIVIWRDGKVVTVPPEEIDV